MEFPQLMICSQTGYKIDTLIEMGLPKNFLFTMEPRHVTQNNRHFNAQSVWDNSTYSSNDFAITWMVLQGKHLYFAQFKKN